MITKATEADIPALVPLLRDLNAHHAAHVPERFHTEGSDAAIAALLSTMMGQGTHFLLYRTESVARGYLAWLPRPLPDSALQHPLRMALLDHIYVEPIWRRRGLASRLVARFESDVAREGFDGWTVQVHAFNHAANALMQRHGAGLAVQSFVKYRTVTG
jgi:GNAT superfamily N-acetyltransferase